MIIIIILLNADDYSAELFLQISGHLQTLTLILSATIDITASIHDNPTVQYQIIYHLTWCTSAASTKSQCRTQIRFN